MCCASVAFSFLVKTGFASVFSFSGFLSVGPGNRSAHDAVNNDGSHMFVLVAGQRSLFNSIAEIFEHLDQSLLVGSEPSETTLVV